MLWAIGAGRLRVHHHARAATTSEDPTTATIHANLRRFAVAINAPFVTACRYRFLPRSSRASLRSDAVCHRFAGSFARHRSMRRRNARWRNFLKHRFAVHDLGYQLRLTRSPERAAPRRHLKEHQPQRENISASIAVVAFKLFGGHVGGGSQNRAPRVSVISAVPNNIVVTYFARPKSRSLIPLGVSITFPGFRSRWMIPWACAVVRASAICAPYCNTLRLASGPFLRPICQRPALHQLHDQVIRSNVVERANVGMIQCGDSPCFSLETRFQGLKVDLDRDHSSQPRVRELDRLRPCRPKPTRQSISYGPRREPFAKLHPMRRCGFEELVHNLGSGGKKGVNFDSKSGVRLACSPRKAARSSPPTCKAPLRTSFTCCHRSGVMPVRFLRSRGAAKVARWSIRARL